MPTTARTDVFEPVHDAHAIEQVTLGVQFDRPLDDASIERIQSASSAFAESLPGKNELRSIGLSIGPQGMSPLVSSSSNAPDGFVRTRVAPNGVVEKELRVERSGIVFRTTAYTRWASVWSEARGYFSTVMGAAAGTASLSSYSVQYVDKFVWLGDASNCRPEQLIRPGSEFVCPVIYSTRDLWHSHSGFFDRADAATKRLLVANLDCVDEPDGHTKRRVVRVTTVVTEVLNQDGYEPRDVPIGDGIAYLDERIDIVHTMLKDVMGRIITPQMCDRIDLVTP